MKKAKCIKCGEEIKFLQLMKHSWKKPISCALCGTKMNFDKKEWTKINIPISILVLIVLITIFVGPKLQNEYVVFFLGLGVFLIFMSIFWLGIKIKGINLVSSEKKT